MACHSRGESLGGSVPSADAAVSKLYPMVDLLPEWRSREQLEPSPPSTSPAYWDTDDDDDSNSSCMNGPKPTDLYGKFTWKIENFSEISKRELRSNVFEVGGYKWYILVYPQGCDVCNHLSLFLCVADYDKLLPGWSHFAQFTIAVVNKDPKKSKYSDTLHRFCKKEHDWGWKKFMELSKVLDGFTVADTLVIKAQVQVIRENPHRPFRCLDCQYRRELVRVYLTNVEGICRRFVEEKREKLGKLMEDTARWNSFQAFWSAVEEGTRWRLAREKTDVILKAVVKRFFNEKEVTSTLVMDALYSGCKSLDYRSRNKKGRVGGEDVEEAINPIVWVDKDAFVLADDVLLLLERVVSEILPPYKDDKGPQNRTKDGSFGDDFGKDSVERDERRLTELGRRTIEMFVLAHLYTNRVEVAYREAVALKRQEELIREEEAAGLAETELRAKREAAEKEKRSKKKQAKQRRKDRKDKDKETEEKRVRVEQENRQRQSESSRPKERMSKGRGIISLIPADTTDDVGTLGLATEDGDVDHTTWERGLSYSHSGMEAAGFSGTHEGSSTRNGRAARKNQASAFDDSSSTCSSDSLPSVRPSMDGSYSTRPSLPEQNHAVLSRARSRGDSDGYEQDGRFLEADGTIMRATGLDPSGPGEASSSCCSAGVDNEAVILSLKERVRWLEQRLREKDEEVVMLQEQVSLFQHQMRLDRPSSHERLPEEASGGSMPGASSAGSSSPADESSSCLASATLDVEKLTDQPIRSSKTVAGSTNGSGHSSTFDANVTTAGRAGNNGDSNSRWFLAFAVNNVDNSSRHGMNPAKVDVGTPKPSLPAKARSTEGSRPPRVGMPPSSSVTSLAAGIEETSSSCSATLSATSPVITRPASAPGLVPAQRSGMLGPVLQSQPPLSRSVSAAGRLVLGAGSSAGAHCNGNAHISPPVSPSYRNAAAGKMKSLAGLASYPISSSGSVHGGVPASMPGTTTSAATLNTPAVPSSSHGSAPSMYSTTPTTSSSSPPLTPASKIRIGPMPSTQSGRTEAAASPSITPTPLQCPVVPDALPEPLSNGTIPQDYICSQGVGGGRRSPVGITFGTVTPEVLHQQQEEDQEHMQPRENDEQAQAQAHQTPPQPCKQESVDPDKQETTVFPEGLSRHHCYGQQAHQRPAHSDLLLENGVLSGDRHSTMSIVEPVNNGGMGEEFPHLDIINDLLEDDPGCFGLALSAMLHQPGPGPFSNRHLSMPSHSGMLKLSQYGQVRSDSSSVNSDGSDRGRTSDDERMLMHEGNTASIRGNRRLSVAFSHQPLGRAQCQHSGHLDNMASHYWPIASAGLPAGNNVRNGLDSRMRHPLVQSHVAVQDCSGFPLRYNGYFVHASSEEF